MKAAPHFDLVLWPSVTLLPYAGFIDKLRFSCDDEDYSQQRYGTWRSYRLNKLALIASSGTPLDVPQLPQEHDFSRSDYVVLFGGQTVASALEQASYLKPFLHAIYRSKAKIVAIDNAVFTLAACGVLDGKTVALHWRHHAQMLQLFPQVKIDTQVLCVSSGRIITSAGGTAAIELAESLLQPYLGPVQAAKGLADMMITERRNMLAPHQWTDTPVVTDVVLHRALVCLSEQLGSTMTVAALCQQIGISRRQLDRKFQTQFELTVAQYWQRLRLQKAAWLLRNTTFTIDDIAQRVALPNVGHFRSVFQRHYGSSPSAYRNANRM